MFRPLAVLMGISIHAPREGGDLGQQEQGAVAHISIHAPREGGDADGQPLVLHREHFNPRPPRGGRPQLVYTVTTLLQFQSTPPARGATLSQPLRALPSRHFNPRPPRGGRRCCSRCQGWWQQFQSTPPARGATYLIVDDLHQLVHFNPRPPRGGRRSAFVETTPTVYISIHAPREGGDTSA